MSVTHRRCGVLRGAVAYALSLRCAHNRSQYKFHQRCKQHNQQKRDYITVSDLIDAKKTVRTAIDLKKLPAALKVADQFLNPWDPWDTRKSFSEVMVWLATRSPPKRLDQREVQQLLPMYAPDASQLCRTQKGRFTWIGHATVFGQMHDLNFVTDPVWSDRCSPYQFIGPRRYQCPPITVDAFPEIDIVLISHSHYDHLDYNSILALAAKNANTLFVVPVGLKQWFSDLGIARVVEMDWWDVLHITRDETTGEIRSRTLEPPTVCSDYVSNPLEGVKVCFVPAQHWTQRNVFKRNDSLWGGYAVIGTTQRFYFAGDTGYHSVLSLIGKVLGPFDISAIPIGAYKPRWFLNTAHCNPEEALEIHRMVKSKQSIGIHWGTFPLADEECNEAALELARVREQKDFHLSEFFTVRPGEPFHAGESPQHDYAVRHPELYAAYLQDRDESVRKEIELEVKVTKLLSSRKRVSDF